MMDSSGVTLQGVAPFDRCAQLDLGIIENFREGSAAPRHAQRGSQAGLSLVHAFARSD